ncbi:hypothetical protein ZWY2020_007100 [Hordeum vulgare]|nr:hypothetical protein ZWY2020_007100 [Hordeum vulgare]
MDDGHFLDHPFQPPVVTRASARYAPWVLLDKKAYFAVRENATTAEAVTSTGNAFRVTFCLADPPAISHFCVHGPEFQRDDLTTEPLVVFSAKDFVLLRFMSGRTRPGSRLVEYFVYKADHGKPSLTLIPRTPPGTRNSSRMCVLPFDDDDGGFVVADLCKTVLSVSDYKLHVFSSRTGKWATTPLWLETYAGVRKDNLPSHFLNKVVALGGGAVGWVDLWRGILTCNVFDKNPVLSFIPIPMLANCKEQRGSIPQFVRDVTFSNGFFKFVELEAITTKKSSDTTEDNHLDSIDDIIHDSDLLFYNDNARASPVRLLAACVGWKLRTCNRRTTWNYWHEGRPVDLHGISARYPDRYMPLPQPWEAAAGRSSPRNLCLTYPTLGMDDSEDVVYIMSKLTCDDKNAWMVGVNLGKKTTDVRVPASSERIRYFNLDLLTCKFSEYLNATTR